MDPASLIPAPDILQVHWPWFHILLLVTFLLHLLLMNVMVGTAFIAACTHLFSKGKGSPHTQTISSSLPISIAFAVNFGVAPLLFVQVLYGQFIYTSSILMAAFWLSIIGLLILAYAMSYVYKYKYTELKQGRALLTCAICALLLLIGFFFTGNLTLMLRPDTWAKYFTAPEGLLFNLSDPALLPRYLHFMTSAVAVGGMSLALYFSYLKSKGGRDTDLWIARGCTWFVYATFINVSIGAWFLSALPEGLIDLSLLPGKLFILFLFTGIITAVASILQARRENVLPAFYWLLTTLISMVLARDMLRSLYLHPYFSPSELTVAPAYSPMVVFLLLFAGGIALIIWMVKVSLKAMTNDGGQS